MSRSLLSLDLGSRFGFCKWKPGLTPKIGTYKLPSIYDFVYGPRNSAFRKWLVNVILNDEITDCVYEENILIPRRDTLHDMKMHVGLSMITEEVCQSYNVNCSSVGIGEWRKHYLGNGKYPTDKSKEYAMNRARASGFSPQHHDAAEALGIMDYTADTLKIKKDWPDSNIFGGLTGKSKV